jgi:hypothetical protein
MKRSRRPEPMKDLKADRELVQDRTHNAADGSLFTENLDPGFLMLPKVLAVSPHDRLAEIAKTIPARNPLFMARVINDPLPRDDPLFPCDDEHSRDVPHAFEAHIL